MKPKMWADKEIPDSYHVEKYKAYDYDLKIGDIVNSSCADWEWDNPMTVITINMCGYGDVTCIGQSGVMYNEVSEAWELVDFTGVPIVTRECLIKNGYGFRRNGEPVI